MDHFSDIDTAYKKLNVRADMLYQFVILYYNYIYEQHTYEAADFNMVEIHILTCIDDTPGITATELSRIWHKSKSAISQTLKKLIEGGYIEKRFKENNEKNAYLYVTEKGKLLSNIHKAYDVADITDTTAYLIDKCGEADFNAFYRVLEEYINLLNSGT